MDIAKIAARLMDSHGLLRQGWTFGFDRAKKRLGCTHFKSRKITLSKTETLRMSAHEIEQLMLHEIAHALLPPDVRHGQRWIELAASIGYEGKRTASIDLDLERIRKAARRWRMNSGGSEEIPPLATGCKIFYKGKIFLVGKINRKNTILSIGDRKWNMPIYVAKLCVVSSPVDT